MDKNLVLLIGSGKTGNVFTSEMLSRDSRYMGLMINSSLGDMSNLPNFELCQNYLIPGVDGSGRNREISKEYIKNRGGSILDTMAKYSQSKIAVFFCSTDGGTGSGSTPLLIRSYKRLYPNKKAILVAIMPRLTENKVSLQNTINFWNDLIDLKQKNLVDSIYLIDNNKRNTFEEINKEATDILDKAFSLNIFDVSGNIDQNDSTIVNTASGYSFAIELNDKYTKLKDAIDQAIKDSVFILPTSYDCDYLGAVLSNNFNIDDLRDEFEVYNTDYYGVSNKENLIVFGGLPIPKEGIEYIQIALTDLENRKNKKIHNNEDDLYIKTSGDTKKTENKIETKSESQINNPGALSSSDLNKILSDNFWDD